MKRSVLVLFVTLALAAAACSSNDGDDGDSASDDTTIEDVLGDPGDCIVVDLAVSPEKIDLLTDLARTFNGSDEAEVDGECVFVRPQRKSSGARRHPAGRGLGRGRPRAPARSSGRRPPAPGAPSSTSA